jgi:antitoxin MazE
MKTTLQRWGNSQGVRLPKVLVDGLGVKVGTPVMVELSADRSQITITPGLDSRAVRGRYRIEDLVAASDPKAFRGECDWGGAQGKEAW